MKSVIMNFRLFPPAMDTDSFLVIPIDIGNIRHVSTFWYLFLWTTLIQTTYYLNAGFKNDQRWLGYL